MLYPAFVTIFAIALHFSCVEKLDSRPSRATIGDNNGNRQEAPIANNESDTKEADSIRTSESVHFEAPCAQCHEPDRPTQNHIPSGECSSCHSFPDWQAVSIASFSHDPKPDECESCHARPETGDRAYPNQGPPANFDPNAASDGSGHYLGKDCISCHQTPAEGEETFVFSHSQPQADFCLPCHFNGGRGEHANDGFAQLSGFGNCFECHKDFDANGNRSFDD